MIKKLLLGLMLVALISAACHNSCICAPGSSVCDSCSDPNGDPSQLEDFGYRYCPCSFGYYTSSISPFTCTEVPNVEDMPQCELQIVGEVIQLNVNTDCKPVLEGTNNFVSSHINLDVNNIIKLGGCLEELNVVVNYKDPSQIGNPIVPFPGTVHSVGDDMTIHDLKIPLGDVEKYSILNKKDDTQLTNEIHVVVEMGHQRKMVRAHTYIIYVYTNRDQVQTFKIDVEAQKTSGCQDGQECIVVADLDVKSKIYTDNTYAVEKTQLLYEVGDVFYAQILFKDATYTKQLLFDHLYFKTDDGKIFDLTSIVVATPITGGLNIQMPLVYPTNQAVISVNMRIGSTRIRALVSTASKVDTANSVFTIVTLPSSKTNTDTNNTNSTDSTNASILALSISAILFLLF